MTEQHRTGQLYAGPRPVRTREDPSPLDKLSGRLSAGAIARSLARDIASAALASLGRGKRRRKTPPSAAPPPTPYKQVRRPRRRSGLPSFTLPSFTLPSFTLPRISLPKLRSSKPSVRRSGGSPACQPPVPAESTSTRCPSRAAAR